VASARWFLKINPDVLVRLCSLAGGYLVGAVAVAAFDGGIAWQAQRAGQAASRAAGLGDGYLYSLSAHVVAMVVLAGFVVTLAAELWRTRCQGLAVAVLAGAVVGPMTLVAAPVARSVIAADGADTRWWWHTVAGLIQGALLLGWTWWTARWRRPQQQRPEDRAADGVRPHVSASSVFVVVTAAGCCAHAVALRDAGNQVAGVTQYVGWSLLAAGLTVAAGSARHRWSGPVAIAGAALAVEVLSLAYERPGGWPGVAGWEFLGMESPIVVSGISAAVLLTGPALALVVRVVRVVRRRIPAGHPGTGSVSRG
jgi:hypothetical protein